MNEFLWLLNGVFSDHTRFFFSITVVRPPLFNFVRLLSCHRGSTSHCRATRRHSFWEPETSRILLLFIRFSCFAKTAKAVDDRLFPKFLTWFTLQRWCNETSLSALSCESKDEQRHSTSTNEFIMYPKD
jgi:hypothetical protein